ncbi:nickel/cobalt transporter [Sulfitobacter aestuarii]|uniref:Nickel/cobalt efflux system n=1 Tax=Sulfitobacter aestuarii TaxID=2161676 RepID=A0ABW5U686_9RHOB
MRRVLTLLALAVLIGLALIWWSGGFDRLAYWAAGQQRAFQITIASSLRAARAGQPGAVIALLSACFAYGLAHAAGPGHGKVLIGGYGLARGVPMLRLSLIALTSALGQALTAVALVYGGVTLLNLGREAMVGVTEDIMAPVSYGAIALIGAWLITRGLRHLRPVALQQGEPTTCASCGHAHGPTLAQVEQTGSLREALVLIAGIALRPCTGALFVLIITWQMGIGLLGIGGTIAMALGTAAITISVGLGAGVLRGGMLAGFLGSPRAATLAALLQILAGALVAVLAGGLLLRAL